MTRTATLAFMFFLGTAPAAAEDAKKDAKKAKDDGKKAKEEAK